MDRVEPWRDVCALIEPFYPNAGNAGPPTPLEQMLHIYLQQWFDLSDPGLEKALYDSLAMRNFVGLNLGGVPDETTILNFRATYHQRAELHQDRASAPPTCAPSQSTQPRCRNTERS